MSDMTRRAEDAEPDTSHRPMTRLMHGFAEAAINMIGSAFNMKKRQPRMTSAQAKVQGFESDIHSLAVDSSQWLPMQVRGGSNAGVPYFIADYSNPDGGDIMR